MNEMIQENEPWNEDAPAKNSAPMGSIFPIIKVSGMHNLTHIKHVIFPFSISFYVRSLTASS